MEREQSRSWVIYLSFLPKPHICSKLPEGTAHTSLLTISQWRPRQVEQYCLPKMMVLSLKKKTRSSKFRSLQSMTTWFPWAYGFKRWLFIHLTANNNRKLGEECVELSGFGDSVARNIQHIMVPAFEKSCCSAMLMLLASRVSGNAPHPFPHSTPHPSSEKGKDSAQPHIPATHPKPSKTLQLTFYSQRFVTWYDS